MERPAIERRRAPRAEAEFAIHLAERGEQRPAQLKDLSTGGLRCHHGEALREMTLVEIGMQLPGGSKVHQVRGAVVRCAKLRGLNPPTYEIAVFFTEVPPECRSAIADYVASQVPA
jgi:hypothetical protein